MNHANIMCHFECWGNIPKSDIYCETLSTFGDKSSTDASNTRDSKCLEYIMKIFYIEYNIIPAQTLHTMNFKYIGIMLFERKIPHRRKVLHS